MCSVQRVPYSTSNIHYLNLKETHEVSINNYTNIQRTYSFQREKLIQFLKFESVEKNTSKSV